MSERLELTPSQKRLLEEAEGWLGLGDHDEAGDALASLPPNVASRPDVLSVNWHIHAARKKWDSALDIASTLTEVAPDSPFGWVHRSFCLHELKRTGEARDNLLPVLDRFPDDALMRYNLACYECQLGELDRAMDWLRKAFRMGDARRFRAMALDDPDLKPLSDRIREMRSPARQ